jgi:hypothetical protein
LGGAFLLAALAGCEGGKEDFLACKLDPLLLDERIPNRPCTTNVEGAASDLETCVVDPHPQCPTDICLSWSGSSPFCTTTCAADGDCPAGSACRGYGVSESDPSQPTARYCVKIDVLRCDTDADCAGGTCNTSGASEGICALAGQQ